MVILSRKEAVQRDLIDPMIGRKSGMLTVVKEVPERLASSDRSYQMTDVAHPDMMPGAELFP